MFICEALPWCYAYWENMCDSIIGTLINIPGKTKDGVKSRLDLIEIDIREQLAPE